MKKIYFIVRYIKYWLKAANEHGIHSPFVFNLYNDVINQKGSFYVFTAIDHLRKKLLLSKKEITVTDFGTGKSEKRSISEITSRAAKSKKYGELLFKMVNYFKPNTIIELGTSLGISTSYLASASSASQIFSIEGCPNTVLEAESNFKSLYIKNIKCLVGNFNEVIPTLIKQIPISDCLLVFFDGNHKKEPTLNYFYQFLALANENSIFIFDDIHWSKEMEDSWSEIKTHPQVTISIDLFFMGVVLFRKGREKENFILKF